MEFGLSALREQVPPIPKTRPSAPPRDPDIRSSLGPKTTGYTPPAKASNTHLPTGRITPDGETYTGTLRVY